ncbi:uncharacterized protein LOC111914118 [Lactuca sativa]|uniref:Serine-rich protein-like protein n=1 Tax=Lactuca sativa TaxID=4236 RepID=A0A9R1X7K1_LACSA|nr:uncharacterized protein LOC111914118 [Lactuca sativa]KAJ0200539.1 hypothetical protein LSAT_V11C600341020 [Lactuca sativa]
METFSKKSRKPVLPLASTFDVHRSISPTGRFGRHSSAFAADMTSPFASSTSSSFCSSPSSSYVYSRPSSPTRVRLHGFASMTSSSVRVSISSRPGSPNRSMAMPVAHRNQVVRKPSSQKTCLCSPTTHPGSFRCSLHKNYNTSNSMSSYSPNRLNARRSAMTNSLVRIATAEGGDLVKRALAALIRPSSHQQRRRSAFEPRPSRLSIMSNADEL